MKTLLFVVSLLFVGSNAAYARSPINDDNKRFVEIKKQTNQNPPRGLFVVPIECYLFSRILYFSFTENLGNSTIIVCGANNNEVKNIDSTDDYLEFNLSNYDNGEYYIEIITENGDVYIGHFNLQ